jgi:DNA-binding LacI/PurR family transcriptional regulator
MDTRIVVASQSFSARFQALIYGHLRRALQPGESFEECEIVRPREPGSLRQHLRAVLKTPSRPVALIGICIHPDPETVAEFRSAGVPIVLINEEVEGASMVSGDNRAGGYLAGKHLAGTGRKSIAVVAGPADHYNAALRVSGFQKALEEHHLTIPAGGIVEAPTYARQDGEAAMARLLRDGPKVDAVFSAAGDTCALGVLSVAKEARVKVPEQIAIIGYDDIPLASVSEPPLSTIRQPLDAIAREAHRLAAQCTAEILAAPKGILVEPSLVLRSTG